MIFKNLDVTNILFPTEKDRIIILERFMVYLKSFWHEITDDTGFFCDKDAQGQEHIYRPHMESMYFLAALSVSDYYDPVVTGVNREELKNFLMKGMRFASYSHKSNDKSPFKGFSWGGVWQSPLWTMDLLKAMYLLGDLFPDEMRELLKKVAAYEADRFLGVDPPSGEFYDTKTEENHWYSNFLAWVSLCFPDHVHARLWEEKAKEFAMNTYSIHMDKVNSTWLDGRRVRDWVTTTNVHPDYTVENHGCFQPSYQKSYEGWGSLIAAYTRANRPVPPQFLHNVAESINLAKQMVLWNGRTAYPCGCDWYDVKMIKTSGVWAELFDDDLLREQFKRMFLSYDKAQRFSGDGSLFGAIMPDRGESWVRYQKEVGHLLGFLDDSWLPSVVPRQKVRQLKVVGDGVYPYPYCEFVICRTPHMFASFTWRNLWQMPFGLVISKGCDDFAGWAKKDVEGEVNNPLIGILEFEGEEETMLQVLTHFEEIYEEENRFSTFGVVNRGIMKDNGEPLWLAKQYLFFAVLPDKRTVLMHDYIKAEDEVSVTKNLGLNYCLENDYLNDNKRRICWSGNERREVVGVGGRSVSIETGSDWLNIDDKISLISASANPFIYRDSAERNDNWKSINYDKVYTRWSEGRFSRGQTIRDESILILTDSTHKDLKRDLPAIEKENENGVTSIKCTDTKGKRVTFFLNTTPEMRTMQYKGETLAIEPYKMVSRRPN